MRRVLIRKYLNVVGKMYSRIAKKFLFLVVLHPCSRAEEEIEISNVIIMRNINIHLPFRGTESTKKIMEGGEKKSD